MNKKKEINNDKAQSIIRQLEIDVEALSKKVNYEEIVKNLPRDEQDGMLAIDSEYDNPWKLMFFAISNILPNNYTHSDRCLEKIRQYNEIGFNFNNIKLEKKQEQEKQRILNILKYDFSSYESIF